MVYKIYLGLVGFLAINSAQGIKHPDCGLWVKDAKIELRCSCTGGDIPYGWFCIPPDVKCPNGYYDIFEGRCKCIWDKVENDTNSGCEHLCFDKCENGVCIGSGKCSCNPGYSISKEDECEPVCAGGCEHGFCVAPEKCNCTEGYSITESNKCEPICEDGCENGYCLHPNWCSCNTGYLRVGMNKCVAHCPDGCPKHGYCSKPGICECDDNWLMSVNGANCY